MNDGLTKMEILAYKNRTLTGRPDRKIVIPINPETFSRNLKIKHDQTQGQGTQGNDEEYTRTEPEEIKYEFIFDNTGTVQGNHFDGTPVADQIDEFLSVTARLNEGRHCPYHLKIVWGGLVFSCQLTDVSINYTLFNPSGEPLRAKVGATFKQYLHPVKRVKLEDKSSPDLTHLRIVKEGDSLQLMAFDIYNDTRYLLQVAKANGLTSTRSLKPGQEVMFPPIKKDRING